MPESGLSGLPAKELSLRGSEVQILSLPQYRSGRICFMSPKLDVPEYRVCLDCGKEYETVWSTRRCSPCRVARRPRSNCDTCGARLSSTRVVRCQECRCRSNFVASGLPDESTQWVAGLLEGEGSFLTQGYRRVISCVMTDGDVIAQLRATIGVGRVYLPTSRQAHHKQAHMLVVGRKSEATALASKLYPYMSSRRKTQISVMLDGIAPSQIDNSPMGWAWLAGVYEGEGTLSLRKSGGATLAITSTDKDTVDSVYAVSGKGKVHGVRPPVKEGWKSTHTYAVYDIPSVRYVTDNIYPYLGERRRAKIDEFRRKYGNTVHTVC